VIASSVSVRARLFAMQREIAGTREVELQLPAGSTLDDAWNEVVRRFPSLRPGRPYLRFARNGEYAEPEAILRDHDEVAFIPPVSGGARPFDPVPGADEIEPFRRLELTHASLDGVLVAELVRSVEHPRIGGIAAFLGVTRETPGTPAPGEEEEAARHAGARVLGLDYEAFEELALRVLAEIADEVAARFGVVRVAIVHRVGSVAVGESSVAIVAGAPHRGEAFAAARYAIDELKARAPIWKSERFADGAVWIGQAARVRAERVG
jgi:molybdopterin converting factor subunit 1